MFITSKTFMTGDEKRLVVVHLGFSKIDKVAKNNLQSLKNSVLICITHFIASIINKSTNKKITWQRHLSRQKRNLVQLKQKSMTCNVADSRYGHQKCCSQPLYYL